MAPVSPRLKFKIKRKVFKKMSFLKEISKVFWCLGYFPLFLFNFSMMTLFIYFIY